MFFNKQSSQIKDSKIALDSRIEVHDRSQFEVQFEYNFLNTLSKKERKKDKKYSIETFFFIPRNMGISSFNYSKSQFYNDLHAYIRFKTPDMTFNQIYDEKSIYSPLKIIRANLEIFGYDQSDDICISTINEAKLFGCLINGYLKNGNNQIKKLINELTYYKNLLKSKRIFEVLEKEVQTFINDTVCIFEKYRSLRQNYEKLAPKINENVSGNIKIVDEYITYRLENSLALIFNEIENLSNLKEINCKDILTFITNIANKESEYRIKNGFICFKNSTSVNYEYYSYRLSALKKHIFQVLYLDIRHIKNEKKYKNLMAMFGAGAAALLYLPAQTMITFNSNITFSLIFIAVLAYMFKDRVKELSKEILLDKILNRFHRFFPDNDLFIQDYTVLTDKSNKKKNLIGRCKEFMRFIDKNKIDKDIITLRNLGHVVDTDEERHEEVIYYRKEVSLSSHKIIHTHHRRTNIKDIIRFNIIEFLDKLDNPTGKINFYDMEKNIFSSLKAPKVYHLNIIFKYSIEDKNCNDTVYQRIRVVLDKNGIVRIEEVIPRSRFITGTTELIEEKTEEKLFSYDYNTDEEHLFDNVNF